MGAQAAGFRELLIFMLCGVLSSCAELSANWHPKPVAPVSMVTDDRTDSTGTIALSRESPNQASEIPAFDISQTCQRGALSEGMSKAQVLKSCWGKPKSISRSVFKSTISEVLFYDGYKYVYLENDVVKSIQGTGR